MNSSFKWIKRYVPDLDVATTDYVDRMTLSGTKVEGYEDRGADLEKILVGQIMKIERHPDADKLIICQVDIGEEEVVQIVTGANNVKEMDKVPVVLDPTLIIEPEDYEEITSDELNLPEKYIFYYSLFLSR